METLKRIKEFLRGYKAYFIGTLTIILGLYQKNTEMIMGGLGIITLRAGISNSK